uniref:C2 domain-containing protein n=1 Tax=Macrostomum lignano TaxID=282301 RepID=A0A1I8GUC0_9PLAT
MFLFAAALDKLLAFSAPFLGRGGGFTESVAMITQFAQLVIPVRGTPVDKATGLRQAVPALVGVAPPGWVVQVKVTRDDLAVVAAVVLAFDTPDRGAINIGDDKSVAGGRVHDDTAPFSGAAVPALDFTIRNALADEEQQSSSFDAGVEPSYFAILANSGVTAGNNGADSDGFAAVGAVRLVSLDALEQFLSPADFISDFCRGHLWLAVRVGGIRGINGVAASVRAAKAAPFGGADGFVSRPSAQPGAVALEVVVLITDAAVEGLPSERASALTLPAESGSRVKLDITGPEQQRGKVAGLAAELPVVQCAPAAVAVAAEAAAAAEAAEAAEAADFQSGQFFYPELWRQPAGGPDLERAACARRLGFGHHALDPEPGGTSWRMRWRTTRRLRRVEEVGILASLVAKKSRRCTRLEKEWRHEGMQKTYGNTKHGSRDLGFDSRAEECWPVATAAATGFSGAGGRAAGTPAWGCTAACSSAASAWLETPDCSQRFVAATPACPSMASSIGSTVAGGSAAGQLLPHPDSLKALDLLHLPQQALVQPTEAAGIFGASAAAAARLPDPRRSRLIRSADYGDSDLTDSEERACCKCGCRSLCCCCCSLRLLKNFRRCGCRHLSGSASDRNPGQKWKFSCHTCKSCQTVTPSWLMTRISKSCQASPLALSLSPPDRLSPSSPSTAIEAKPAASRRVSGGGNGMAYQVAAGFITLLASLRYLLLLLSPAVPLGAAAGDPVAPAKIPTRSAPDIACGSSSSISLLESQVRAPLPPPIRSVMAGRSANDLLDRHNISTAEAAFALPPTIKQIRGSRGDAMRFTQSQTGDSSAPAGRRPPNTNGSASRGQCCEAKEPLLPRPTEAIDDGAAADLPQEQQRQQRQRDDGGDGGSNLKGRKKIIRQARKHPTVDRIITFLQDKQVDDDHQDLIQDLQLPLLRKILNVIFITLGVVFLLGVIVVIIYTNIGKDDHGNGANRVE